MDPLSYLTAAMSLVPLIIQAEQDIAPFAENVYNVIAGGKHVTPDDWDKLHAKEDELRKILNQ